MSKGAKWAIGITGTIASAGILMTFLAKRNTQKAIQFYKENMVFQNLGEHLEYKDAKTMEEALKYTKEVLKIPEVDSGFTLEGINFANRGLVKVANANKGKLFMPKKLQFIELDEDIGAHVIDNMKSKDFGCLAINKKLFEKGGLDGHIDKFMMLLKRQDFPVGLDENTYNLYQKFKQDKNILSVSEKWNLFYTIKTSFEECVRLRYHYPEEGLKKIEPALKSKGININIDEFLKLSKDEQKTQLGEYLSKLRIDEKSVIMPSVDSEMIIYHEMGHLQDFAKNLEKYHLKDLEKDDLTKNSKPESLEINNLYDRWMGRTYETIEYGKLDEFLKKNPKKFKKHMPSLYEFLTNPEIQKTVRQVSSYATSGIGEFIAEVYAGLIQGKTFSKEVMELYEKYNGPKVGEAVSKMAA